MITKIIEPIKLLSGSHPDLYETGQGCFMNVIAYLNGEPQITDQSTCVCVVVKPIAIFMNDFLNDADRNLLIPYIERAMGSATDEKIELVRRANLVVSFAKKCEKISAKYSKYAAESAKCAKYSKYAAESAKCAKCAKYSKYAAESAAESAKYAAEYSAKSAAESAAESAKYAAESAAESAKYAAESAAEYYNELKNAGFEFLNAALPTQIIDSEIIVNRAKSFCAIAS